MYIRKRGQIGNYFGQLNIDEPPTLSVGGPAPTSALATSRLTASDLGLRSSSDTSSSSSVGDIMGSISGLIGALAAPAASVYSAKITSDAAKAQAKLAAQNMFMPQQPVIIQQSGSSNTALWIVLGIIGFISVGGIVFFLARK